jgi:uncharacterized protein with NRDE domain
MCLISLDWRPEARPSLILASNRDEYYERPSQQAQYWKDQPHIYGGRDLLLGGSWLTCSTNGRLAAVTNFFSKEDRGKKYPKSRGEIITNFASSNLSAKEFAIQYLEPQKDEYSGFSALLFDGTTLVCCSNRDPKQFLCELPAGTYGLSNHLLNTPWPKVEKAKQALTKLSRDMTHDQLVAVLLDELHDATRVSDKSLLPTTLGEEEEHIRSAVCVQGQTFGTRTTTIVTFDDQHGFEVTEENYETPFASASLSHGLVPTR